jgi:glutamate formiminotransferase
MADGLAPDFGPPTMHPTAGATLVAARPPLVAFNLELAPPATEEDARRIALLLRESGAEGLPALRAIGLSLRAREDVAQLSCNVEDHEALPLAELLAAVERHAVVAEAELVGLAPEAAFAGWPDRVPIRNRATIEERLSSVS